MKWMQFLTPVSSITWEEVDRLSAKQPEDGVVLLDVRQPGEYEARHMPGAKLVPLGELDKRLDELDRKKPLVVY
jgi:rhodanese-related sulfurtransferase